MISITVKILAALKATKICVIWLAYIKKRMICCEQIDFLIDFFWLILIKLESHSWNEIFFKTFGFMHISGSIPVNQWEQIKCLNKNNNKIIHLMQVDD